MAKNQQTKVAIIGAGFTGLAAAWDLINQGFAVEVYEANDFPGGLAAGIKDKNWSWSVEHHYHHIFKTDSDAIKLLTQMGLADKLFFSKVNTRSYYQAEAWSIDSPISLLRFSPLPFFSRLRVGLIIAFLKFLPIGKFLERFTAQDFLTFTMGKKAWQVLWEPLFVGKFGSHSNKINMAWFWARIATRSQQLGYYQGGFLKLAEDMVDKLEAKGVQFHFSSSVKKIIEDKQKIKLVLEKNKQLFADKVLVTVPAPIFSKIFKSVKTNLSGLAARTILLELDKPFFLDKTYWLSIHQTDWPFLAVVEHTNLAGIKNYGGKHLLYIGKYLDRKDKFYELSLNQILKEYAPYLDKLSPGWKDHVLRQWIFDADFAQPLVYLNHSESLPPIEVIPNRIIWLSMQHVYPWDRGINYAIRFGRKITSFFKKNE